MTPDRKIREPQRFRLAPLATASSWLTIWGALHDAAMRARGGALTNREAVAIVTAFKALAPFQLWHQFAAVAYGWDAEHGRFDTSSSQADRMYPLTSDLWAATKAIATELENGAASTEPRLELDADDFSDVLVQGTVKDALIQDGAKVLAAPTPAPQPKRRPVIEVGATEQPKKSESSRLLMFGLAIGGLWLAFGRKKPKPRRRIARRRTKARARYAAT